MAFEQRLIQLVKERKCLYHTKSRSSRNNLMRMALWQNIARELGRPVTECKQRWRSLRDRFVREKKKMDLGDYTLPDDRWEHFDALTFLIGSVQRRKRHLESPVVPDNESYEESYQGSPLKIECTTILSDANDDFVVPNFLDETSHSIASISSGGSLQDTKELFIEGYGKINTVANNQSMSEPNENPLHFETVQDIPSKNTVKPSKTTLMEERESPVHFQTEQSFPCTSKRAFATLNNVGEAFIELLSSLKGAVDSKPLPEKDENDMFLEWIGKKMKRLSEAAKLRIQAKLLADVTEELLKE